MPIEKKKREDHVFHCQLPIFICPTCSKADHCKDLGFLLRTYRLVDKPTDEELLDQFPFLAGREEIEPVKTPSARSNSPLNDLSSGEWLKFTRTALRQGFPLNLGHEKRRLHPEAKSPYLMGQLIAFFTKKGDSVLDPFAGTGSALLAASLLGRRAAGFEIHQEWIDAYYDICEAEKIAKQTLTQGNCGHLIRFLPGGSIDFVVVDPPELGDPANQDPLRSGHGPESMDEIFDFFKLLFEFCEGALAPKRYMAVFVKNLYRKGRYHMLEPFYISAAEAVGFTLKGEKIWDNASERMRPFGYPHSYVPNITHHSILIFQK